MIANLLVLLLVIGLAVLFGWLCYRAIRAKRLWVKIVGGIGAGLLTLVFVAVAFMGGKGVAAAYFPGAPAAPNLTVARTPEQIARGEYLVNLSCIGCHSAVGSDGAPSLQHPLNGGTDMAATEGFGFIGAMVAENLTPGGKLAGYSDGELFRALRYSVDQQGHNLGFMSFLPYAQLSDQDTQAIIAYLRSLPPAKTAVDTGDRVNFVGALMLGAGMFGPPPARSPGVVTAPPAATTAEYGKYVATRAQPATERLDLDEGAIRTSDAHRYTAQRRCLHRGHAMDERRKDDRQRPGRAVRVSQGAGAVRNHRSG
ncbi:MAG: cytochrome c [Anaerolineae bacterium]|nr:cytochrome c [Anaerolineae bacterium]